MATHQELYHLALDELEKLRERIINSEVEVESVEEKDSNFRAKGITINYHELKSNTIPPNQVTDKVEFSKIKLRYKNGS